jgi:hypothetical protein
MPNWCSNVVVLSKEGYDMQGIVDKVKVHGLFGQFIKRSTPLSEAAGQYGVAIDYAEYQFNLESYGTKWDVNHLTFSNFDGEELTLEFETAWSPPKAFYEHLVKQGFNVRGSYWEPGMAFGGFFFDEFDDLYWVYDDLVEKDSEVYYQLLSDGLITEEDFPE